MTQFSMPHETVMARHARPERPAPASRGVRKVFIKTYGCQMNVYDTARMNDILSAQGFTQAELPEEADLVILNTCHIREKAAEKVYSDIGRLRKLKQQRAAKGKNMAIAVAGCVAQAEGEEIIRRAPAVDLVFGPQSYHYLPRLLEEAAKGKRVVETEFPSEDKFGGLPPLKADAIKARGPSAFLTVQEGCDKFCTFCVVPYTRGAEVSRPAADVLAEAHRLVAAGVKEITLLGQNVNAYHGKAQNGATWSLGRLLEELCTIGGLKRLRYTTSHPRDMDEALIAAHRDLPQVMPYLHLPVQSGSSRILKTMNRRHTREDYLRLIERIRSARPDLALSSDFIVGFPGETDEDFEETMTLVQEVGYAQAFSFKYSPRPGTPAAEHQSQVPEQVKSQRLQRLQALLGEQQAAFNASKCGATMEVLLDRKGHAPGQLAGRSPWLQAVHVKAPDSLIGTLQNLTITSATKNSLQGQLCQPEPALCKEGSSSLA